MVEKELNTIFSRYIIPPLVLSLTMSGGDDSLRRYSSYKWSILPYIYSEGTGMGQKQILGAESKESDTNG